MTNNVSNKNASIEDNILEEIDYIAFRLRFLSDEELACLVKKLISQGTGKVTGIIRFAANHGGKLFASRVSKLLRTHDAYGSGKHLWNRVPFNCLVLVEASDA